MDLYLGLPLIYYRLYFIYIIKFKHNIHIEDKSKVEILQNFVASEYMNFT